MSTKETFGLKIDQAFSISPGHDDYLIMPCALVYAPPVDGLFKWCSHYTYIIYYVMWNVEFSIGLHRDLYILIAHEGILDKTCICQ